MSERKLLEKLLQENEQLKKFLGDKNIYDHKPMKLEKLYCSMLQGIKYSGYQNVAKSMQEERNRLRSMDDFWDYFLNNLQEFAEMREDEMLLAQVLGAKQVFKKEKKKSKKKSKKAEESDDTPAEEIDLDMPLGEIDEDNEDFDDKDEDEDDWNNGGDNDDWGADDDDDEEWGAESDLKVKKKNQKSKKKNKKKGRKDQEEGGKYYKRPQVKKDSTKFSNLWDDDEQLIKENKEGVEEEEDEDQDEEQKKETTKLWEDWEEEEEKKAEEEENNNNDEGDQDDWGSNNKSRSKRRNRKKRSRREKEKLLFDDTDEEDPLKNKKAPKKINYLKLEDLTHGDLQDFPTIYIDEINEEFEDAKKYILSQSIMGIDSEFKSNGGAVYIQIASKTRGFVFNMNKNDLKFAPECREFFKEYVENEKLKKVGFNVSSDVKAINRAFQNNLDPKGFFSVEDDLFLCRTSNQLGLGSLCKRAFGKEMDKSLQMWVAETEDLGDEEIRYAVLDALAPLVIYNKYKKVINDSILEDVIKNGKPDLSGDNEMGANPKFICDFTCRNIDKIFLDKGFNSMLLENDCYEDLIEKLKENPDRMLVTNDKVLLQSPEVQNYIAYHGKKPFVSCLKSFGIFI